MTDDFLNILLTAALTALILHIFSVQPAADRIEQKMETLFARARNESWFL